MFSQGLPPFIFSGGSFGLIFETTDSKGNYNYLPTFDVNSFLNIPTPPLDLSDSANVSYHLVKRLLETAQCQSRVGGIWRQTAAIACLLRALKKSDHVVLRYFHLLIDGFAAPPFYEKEGMIMWEKTRTRSDLRTPVTDSWCRSPSDYVFDRSPRGERRHRLYPALDGLLDGRVSRQEISDEKPSKQLAAFFIEPFTRTANAGVVEPRMSNWGSEEDCDRTSLYRGAISEATGRCSSGFESRSI